MITGTSIASPPAPNQLPTGGAVAAGSATINTAGSTMNINQASNRVAINWNGFDIGSNATVNFVQPSASAVALNRVNSANPSQIYGNLNANGQVFLLNSAGIYFAPGANVNVGGIVATTHQMGDADFMNGSNTFSRNGATGSVVNDGTIKSGIGGYIALLAPEVQNNGVMVAQQGTVALAGGEAITLNFGDLAKLNSLTIAPSLIKTLVENKLAIQAPDGLIVLSARAVNQLTGSVINSGGLQADGITQSGGRIILEASSSITHSGNMSANAAPTSTGSGGTISIIADLSNPSSVTSINGSISAKAGNLGGDGGNIETSASKVSIGDLTTINTSASQGKSGTIDPTDFTVASSGGDITGTSLSSQLSTTGVAILSTLGASGTAGNININDAITWSSNTALTLNAQNNININSEITATGASAKLALRYGQGAASTGNLSNYFVNAPINLQSGNNFSTKLGSDGSTINYTVIKSLGAAGSIGGLDLQGINGVLNGNFALGSNLDASSTTSWNSGAGFAPIGSLANPFSGRFDGLGHTISALTINQPTNANIGLFGATLGATTIQNIGLLGGTTIGAAGTGGLVGNNDAGLIKNSYNTGSVTGAAGTGGLVGSNISGNLINDYATGNVKGDAGTGGLLGSSTNITGSVSYSYATGIVDGTGSQNLVGIGGAGVGGLVGSMGTGSIDNSYATGNIYGAAGSGGLVGSITGNIRDSYATGNIYGAAGTGGIAGSSSGVVANSYATGNSVGAAGTSSLVGDGTSSYANAANVSNSVGLGLANTFAPSIDYSKAITITVTTNSASKTYNGLIYSGGYSVNYLMPLGAVALGLISYSGLSQSAINVNNYSIISSGLIPTPTYKYLFNNGTLAITPADLILTGTQVYNGTTTLASSNLTATGVLGQTFALTGLGTSDLTTANVQTNQTLANVTHLALGVSTAGSGVSTNYNAITTTGSSVNITPADLTVYVNDSIKIINTPNPVFTSTVSGFQGSDNLVNSTNNIINYSTAASTRSGVGNYLITATGLISKVNNYIINDIDGTLKITASTGINSLYSQPPSLSSQCTKSFAYDNATPRSTC